MNTFVKTLSLVVIAAAISSCSSSIDSKSANYELKPNAALAYAISNENVMDLQSVVDIIKFQERYPNIQLIDLRTPDEFVESHIPGAVNIPLKSLVNKDSWHINLSSDKVNLLFGRVGDDAAEAGLLLKMIGVNNFQICYADYNFIKNNVLDNYSVYNGSYNNEVARYDYAQIVAETAGISIGASSGAAPPPASAAPIVKRTKKAAGGGGCD